MLIRENKKYKILSQDFKYRENAMEWMLNEYTKHPPESIIASNFAEDPDRIIAYIMVDQAKLKPEKKKLIKII